MSAEELRSLRAVAGELRVPVGRLRREAARFAEFIPTVSDAGGVRYSDDAVALLRHVLEARERGESDAVIATRLQQGRVALAPPVDMPEVELGAVVSALNRRRTRNRRAMEELKQAVRSLSEAVSRHEKRVDRLASAAEAHGGDLNSLRPYDPAMARLRAELRTTERSLADAFRIRRRRREPSDQ